MTTPTPTPGPDNEHAPLVLAALVIAAAVLGGIILYTAGL